MEITTLSFRNEKEIKKLAHILNNQTAITDELTLREPEKVKKFKRYNDEDGW